MAEYPAPGRRAIETELQQLQVKKTSNLQQIATLEAENDQIDISIQLGEDTLAFIESQTTPLTVTGLNLILDGGYHPVITYDDAGTGVTYQIQRAQISDFSDASDVYTGIYNSGIVDASTTLNPGDTWYYRAKAMKMGLDDSDWATDSITRP